MTTSPANSSSRSAASSTRPAHKPNGLVEKWLRARWLWLVVGIASLLIAIASIPLGLAWAGTVVFLIPALSALATALPDRIRKHLRLDEFFFPASLVVLLLLILAIAALWLSVRLFWIVEESRRTTTTGSVASVRRAALEFSAPARVLANDQPVTLTLTSLLSVLTLSVEVELPPELRFYPGERSDRKQTVTLFPGEVVALPIVNSRQNYFNNPQSTIAIIVSGEQYDPLSVVHEKA